MNLSKTDKLHLVLSFVLALVTRWLFIKSIVAWLPLLLIFVAKEVYDCYKPKPTGFSIKDLKLDLIGGSIGYLLGLLCNL